MSLLNCEVLLLVSYVNSCFYFKEGASERLVMLLVLEICCGIERDGCSFSTFPQFWEVLGPLTLIED